MRRQNLLDFFETFADKPRTFLISATGYRPYSYTYRQTGAAARRFAGRLRTAGLTRGDRVLIWSENRPEWIAAFWGCLLAGVVAVPLDYRGSPEFVARVQGITNARLILLGDNVAGVQLPIPAWRLAELVWNGGAAEIRPDPDPMAEILFTSGATADPKGVLIEHRNILANIVPIEQEVAKYIRYARPFQPIRFLNLLPLSHMFGQAMAAFIPPMVEGEVIFAGTNDPRQTVSLIRRRRISVVVCVPKTLETLRTYVLQCVPEASAAAPPGTHWLRRWWRYRRAHRMFGWKFWAFVVGGAPLDSELEAFWTGLGFVVIQGYGLTETAPIVTLNHPFHARRGSVGKPIGGVQVKIAPDGEVLVRGANVSQGYLNAELDSDDGWLRTGDIGSLDAEGNLNIVGRKKEMIVTPEGLNVFPDDVERVLNSVPGVRDSAVVGRDRVHAVLLLGGNIEPEAIVRDANARLADHQKIRSVTVWPGNELPRTEGTRKLKRREIQAWVQGERTGTRSGTQLEDLLAQYAPGRTISPATTLDELGLSSIERVELLMKIEQRLGASLDERSYTEAATVGDLMRLNTQQQPRAAEPHHFPRWNRSWWARALRRINLPTWILPAVRIFVHLKVTGLEHLADLDPPVIFAPNHQSHLDVPALLAALPAKWRYRLAPAMSREFFDAHFHGRGRLGNTLNYYLATLLFNGFTLPQRETGARDALQYAGELAAEGWCIVLFPEGKITTTGEIAPFQPGVGLLASKLGVPVVPVRLHGLDKVLHRTWKMARPGPVEVRIGPPLRLQGDSHTVLAAEVERAVRSV